MEKKMQLFKNSLLLLSFIAFGVYSINAQVIDQSDSWFKVKKVADKTWCISDHEIDNIYLLEGNKKALLIDNGMGVANISDLVKSITKLPVTVVITHGHLDHSGATFQFPIAYANSLDFKSIKDDNLEAQRKNRIKSTLKDFKLAENEIFKDTVNLNPTKLKSVKDGFTFDLGGRKIEVIEVPGHTPGSIVLLDKANKMLFAGDNDNGLVWLFLNGCTPLETYLKSLEKLQKRSNEFTIIYPGHGESVDSEFLSEQINCGKSILDGSCKGEKYTSFAGDGKLCNYKRAGIAFNPDNLFIKK
jgi:glyoxylase-like metal-dependent hydrolase (beta-lactamase superfamily II)